MVDMYKIAAQNTLRFLSPRGLLTVENLFQLPLKVDDGFDLDTVARTVNNDLKTMTEESFVQDTKLNPYKVELELKLEIVKDVIKTKQEQVACLLAKRTKAMERKKILDALASKKDQALTTATVEELEKKLAELET